MPTVTASDGHVTPKTHPKGSKVWMPHPKEAWTVGDVVKWEGEVQVHVRALSDGKAGVFKPSAVCALNPVRQDGAKDNTALMYLHEATLLHNLQVRYDRDEIYTFTANILIAINPYKTLSVYSKSTMAEYKGKSIGVKPPHVFAVADHAYRNMKSSGKNQSLLISGESGAGKTESCKYVLRYMTLVGGSGESGDLERRIMLANPILECFGNAKTIRNNNSSRFGKFTELNFDKHHVLNGSSIVVYLLERSRIVFQSKNERNYHSFYALLASRRKDAFQLAGTTAKDHHYTNQGQCDSIAGDPDDKRFAEVLEAMQVLGFSAEEIDNVWRTVAGVLHLGDISFKKDKVGQADAVEITNTAALKKAADMLGFTELALRDALMSRTMTTRRGRGTVLTIPLNLQQAVFNRDAFAKTVYARLFDHLVKLINRSIRGEEQREHYIGVLDIFGFESFKHNSFEQFCINYANEKLQQQFNNQVLRADQEIYAREGIPWKPIAFDDNSDVIDVIEKRGSGVLAILDEQSTLSKATDQTFAAKLHQTYQKHARLLTTRAARIKGYRDEEAFVVRHFAGDVAYEVDGFLAKNNDTLTGDLNTLVMGSSWDYMRGLFPMSEDEDGAGKKLKMSISRQFHTQLDKLMDALRSTNSHFIRCIKPNSVQRPRVYERPLVMNQLLFNGMVATLKVFSLGYPTRVHYNDLYERYKEHMPRDIASLAPREFNEALLIGLEVDRSEFALGITRVFFKAGRMAFLDQLMGPDFHKRAPDVVKRVRKFLRRKRFRRAIWVVLSVVIMRDLLQEKRDGERYKRAIASLDHKPMESEVKAWFNAHLRNARSRRNMTNFGSDLRSGEMLIKLLHQIEPDHVSLDGIKEKDYEKRASWILRRADRFGCRPKWMTAEDIYRGSALMNFAFCALLFNTHPDVGPSQDQVLAEEKARELEVLQAKQQAEAAEQRERMKELEAKAIRRQKELDALRETARLEEQRRLEDVQDLQYKLQAAETAAQEAEAGRAAAQRELDDLEDRLRARDQELAAARDEVRSLQRQIEDDLAGQQRSLEDKLQRTEARIAETEAQRAEDVREARRRADAAEAETARERDTVVALKRELADAQARAESLKRDADDTKGRSKRDEEALHAAKLKQVELKRRLEQAEADATKHQGAAADYEARARRYEAQIEELTSQLSEANAGKRVTEGRANALKEMQEQRDAEMAQLRQRVEQLQRERDEQEIANEKLVQESRYQATKLGNERRNEVSRLESDRAALEAAKTVLEQQTLSQATRIRGLENQMVALNADLRKAKDMASAATQASGAELERVQRKMSEKRNEGKRLKTELETLKKKNLELSKHVSTLETELKRTLEDGMEADDAAAAEIAELSSELRLANARAERAEQQVQKAVSGNSLRLLLVRPERRGFVMKQRFKLVWLENYLVLRNNYLNSYSNGTDLDDPTASLDLSQCDVAAVPAAVIGRPFVFVVTLRSTASDHYFQVTSEDEVKAWVSLCKESQHRQSKALSKFKAMSGDGTVSSRRRSSVKAPSSSRVSKDRPSRSSKGARKREKSILDPKSWF